MEKMIFLIFTPRWRSKRTPLVGAKQPALGLPDPVQGYPGTQEGHHHPGEPGGRWSSEFADGCSIFAGRRIRRRAGRVAI